MALIITSVGSYASSIEGYWKSIDDRTGEQLSIVEIRKGTDGYYHGKIVYRYPNAHGIKLANCVSISVFVYVVDWFALDAKSAVKLVI